MPRGGRGGSSGGRGGSSGGRGGRGAKKNHKGGRRHFTDEDEINRQMEKKERQAAWNKQRGIGDEEDEESSDKHAEDGAIAPRRNFGLPPSDSESESGSESEEEEKHKGVSHLIEIENPNHVGGRILKKVTELDETKKTQLSRKEREELEKQQAKAHYQKLHMEGKTEEARADLARLALIRKQREEAAKKREEEKRAAEEAAKKKS